MKSINETDPQKAAQLAQRRKIAITSLNTSLAALEQSSTFGADVELALSGAAHAMDSLAPLREQLIDGHSYISNKS